MDIEIKRLSVTYPSVTGDIHAIRDVSLTVPAGKITALVGESGSGKSVLGEAILGLLPRQARVQGEILYEGENVLTYSEEEWNVLRGKKIGWIAQNPVTAMNPMMRIGPQVIELISFLKEKCKKKIRLEGIEQLDKYGLAGAQVYDRYPWELSGGMAQRALTAMATMPEPQWVIADEPTKGLDAMVRGYVCRAFRRLREEHVGFILITHDLRMAEVIADYTAILYAGELLEWGTTQEVFSAPQHPYTERLIEAQPHKSMRPIPGDPANLSSISQGCIFASRCSLYKTPVCDQKQILRKCGLRHMVRCSQTGEGL